MKLVIITLLLNIYINVYSRDLGGMSYTFDNNEEVIDLSKNWEFSSDFNLSHHKEIISFPFSWNYTNERLYPDKIGKAVFKKKFILNSTPDKNWILDLGRFSLQAKVILNGKIILNSKKPYLDHFIATEGHLKKGHNSIIIEIENTIDNDSFPTKSWLNKEKLGWFPHGGIFGKVKLRKLNCALPTIITLDKSNTHYTLDFKYTQPHRCIEKFNITLNGNNLEYDTKRVIIEKEDIKPTSPKKISRNSIILSHNKIYKKFYFGTKELHVKKRTIFLNNQPFFLRGMNLHAENTRTGPIVNRETIINDVNSLKELNVNFIRPGHYPNDHQFLDQLDENNIFYSLEVPIYQSSGKKLKKDVEEYKKYLKHMLENYSLRPGFIMVSIANEVASYSKKSQRAIREIHDYSKKLAPELLTIQSLMTFPIILRKTILPERMTQITDILGLNIYVGWYWGKVTSLNKVLRYYFKKTSESTPIVITEFGAGAYEDDLPSSENYDQFIDIPIKYEWPWSHTFSYKWQTQFYTSYLKTLKNYPIAGMMPWVLRDFYCQWEIKTRKRDLPQNRNFKGLMTIDGLRKPSFYLFKTYYESIL